eukprot:GHVL01001122.1.p1 GENE.GHVL01001122.1~~GHVL01001122.1.p1  ORF type:complete len:194 (-),score=44.69 GHVL01001122.1:1360-1941(-)
MSYNYDNYNQNYSNYGHNHMNYLQNYRNVPNYAQNRQTDQNGQFSHNQQFSLRDLLAVFAETAVVLEGLRMITLMFNEWGNSLTWIPKTIKSSMGVLCGAVFNKNKNLETAWKNTSDTIFKKPKIKYFYIFKRLIFFFIILFFAQNLLLLRKIYSFLRKNNEKLTKDENNAVETLKHYYKEYLDKKKRFKKII